MVIYMFIQEMSIKILRFLYTSLLSVFRLETGQGW